MKKDIHPKYAEVTVTCACGTVYQTRSTIGRNFSIEICSSCHPVYTGGKSRLLDTAGNIEKFNRRFRKPAQ